MYVNKDVPEQRFSFSSSIVILEVIYAKCCPNKSVSSVNQSLYFYYFYIIFFFTLARSCPLVSEHTIKHAMEEKMLNKKISKSKNGGGSG